MKKLAVLILTLAMSLWLVGCTQTASIQLPFEASDVKSLELFRFSVPAQAEKAVSVPESELPALT